MVRQGLAAEVPQFFKDEGGSDDGRASIKGKAVLAIDITAPTRTIEFFVKADAIAFCPQADGGSQPPEASANNNGMWTGISAGRGEIRRFCCKVHWTIKPAI